MAPVYRHRWLLLTLLLGTLGCSVQPTIPARSTATATVAASASGIPSPSIAPTRILTPAPTASAAATASDSPVTESEDAQQIAALLDSMQNAVVARNRELYLSYVDLSDPVFALEHTRWADDWSQKQVTTQFRLSVSHLSIRGDEAAGDLTMSWSTLANPQQQSTTFPVRFRRGNDRAWRYAGEAWVSFNAPHFRVRALPGLEQNARSVVAGLPEVYDYDTHSLEHEPAHVMEIKLYPNSAALVANTLLSLPPIGGWNEPGESLKLVADPKSSSAPVTGLAHEFTHFIEFDMAGTAHSRMPWWLSEGLATYIASHFERAADRDARLNRVREWATRGELVAWARMSDFNTTPTTLWQYVYPQGYAFMRYVTETFGEKTRNAWIRNMAVEMDLPQSTQKVFKMSFDELDAEFRAWLKNSK